MNIIDLPIIPCKDISSHKTGQHIVAANHPTTPDQEEGKGDCKDKKRLSIHKPFLLGIMQQFFSQPSHCNPVNDTQQDGVTPSLAKPQPYSLCGTTLLTSTAYFGVFDQI